MKKKCECYEEEVQPYWKTDYKLIIYTIKKTYKNMNEYKVKYP